MLEVGKLYRYYTYNGKSGQIIRGCIVKRGGMIDNGLSGWLGDINTIEDITEYAGAMLLVEYYEAGSQYMPYGIFLVGDRYVMLDPAVVELV